MILRIYFFYESNAAVNMEANVLMIMEASSCTLSFVFMKGMSTGVALSSTWVIETSRPHENVEGNGLSKACKRKRYARGHTVSQMDDRSVQRIA